MLTDALTRLRNHIDEVPSRLVNFSEPELTDHLPGKWSRKEILGHLIDSAINNLKRFTDAQSAEGSYLIQSYNQNKLVVVNQYQKLPLAHLLTLWSSLNRQILAVAEAIPTDTLNRSIQISQAIQPADVRQLHTLGWLIEDYVIHLEHHLKTLL
ncbi:DinB family protein [Spirosoma sp. HMF4905]|uniref:DinB family protein n=1 Tax=Spirosoma arboris TaxID=2682092 RepID=A0A7K1SGJ0_9BACT|nr:DinB family protein [Spirosoma arboris]MVM32696.1 DinB family protein [Spirosoma arboris]